MSVRHHSEKCKRCRGARWAEIDVKRKNVDCRVSSLCDDRERCGGELRAILAAGIAGDVARLKAAAERRARKNEKRARLANG